MTATVRNAMGRSESSTESSPEQRPPSSGDGYTALAYMISGIGLYGGLGWLLDRWLDTGFFLPTGLIVGGALGVYLIARRFNKS